MDLKFKLSLFFLFSNTVTRTLYTRQNRSNGLQKRFGDIKRTPLREVSNFIVAFQRKTEIVFVRNSFKSIQALTLIVPFVVIVTGDYSICILSWNIQHLLNWGRKEYVSVSVKHNCTRCYGISR